MTTFFAGDELDAADLNLRTTTRVGTTNAQSPGSTTSGTTELAVDTVTFTAVAGQRYEVKYWFKYTATVSADRFVVRVRQGSGTGGTELESRVFVTPASLLSTLTEPLELDYVPSSSGSTTLQATVARTGGTGALTVQGSATANRWLKVNLALDS